MGLVMTSVSTTSANRRDAPAIALLSDLPHSPRMQPAEAERVLRDLKDDHPYPAMVVDRILLDVQREHGHAAVNRLIDTCELVRRFGIRKVWPD